MKARGIKAIIMIWLIILLLISLISCDVQGEKGDAGEQGAAGENGKSAYELAVENGYVGTLEEWLDSLVGKTGEQGVSGAPGTPGATPKLRINSETNIWEVSYDGGESWESLNVPATGESGAPGAPGAPGTPGATPKLRINSETNMWEVSYDGGESWESLNVPATGESGAPGTPGAVGNGVTDAYINSTYHLILVLSDGTKIDAGYVGVSLTPSPDPIFTVTFTDYDGTVLDIQTVKSGEDATPPENPVRDGYTFSGWDGTYTSVTADCTVVATYVSEIPSFTVTFVDHDSTVLSTQAVFSGESATPPTDPTREGYVFAGWIGTYTDVLADCTVIATYKANVTAPAVVVDECVARRGGSVAVTVAVCQNPGIASMKLTLVFDNTVLTLDRVVYNTAIGGQALLPQSKKSPLTLNWFDGAGNVTGDFVFATLYFTVSDAASAGNYTIEASYNADDIYNIEETNIEFAVISGKITVTE